MQKGRMRSLTRGAAMTKLGCWWYRGGLASLALGAWVASESFCQAQSLRPSQPNWTRTSGTNSSGTRSSTSAGSIGSPYYPYNNGSNGNIGGTYKVPNYSRTSTMVPGVGSVTTGY